MVGDHLGKVFFLHFHTGPVQWLFSCGYQRNGRGFPESV